MAATSQFLPELLSYLDGQPEPRIIVDSHYQIVAANQAYHREFGQALPVIGRRCYEVSHHFNAPCDQVGETCPLKSSLESGETRRVLHLHHTRRGEEHVEVETIPIRDQAGQLVYFVETMQVVQQASSRPATEGLVGRSASFNRMLAQIMRVAPTEASTLLLGETGTGKELVARMIHEASKRASKPFVAVDCSGLTDTLFESELFGYEKGAFTGANHRKIGLIEAASGGTLFLDEIGDVPLPMQVKLLRLLESGTYRRVGGVETLRANFRLVCATHRPLEQLVEQEAFRRDLFHRIDVFPIHVPSLAERVDDIPLLAESLLKRVAPERVLRFSAAALSDLQSRVYPGNIRQLRNLIERASILCDGPEIGPEHLVSFRRTTGSGVLLSPAKRDFGASQEGAEGCFNDLSAEAFTSPSPFVSGKIQPLEALEKNYLAWAEKNFAGDRKALAEALGLSTRTLFRKLAQHGDASGADEKSL